MATMPSWFWILGIDLGFFAVGISIVWYFARRELRGDRPKRRRARAVMRVLELRLERLLMQPPRWEHVARKLRPYLFGALGVTLGSLAVWALWTHAGNWFADVSAPPALPPSNGSGLPYERAFSSLRSAITGPLATAVGLIALVGAGASFVIGEGRRASFPLAVAVMVFAAGRCGAMVLDDGDQPISVSSAVVRPLDVRKEEDVDSPTDADEKREVAEPGEQEAFTSQHEADVRAEGEGESIESQLIDSSSETTPAHRHISSHKESHFGFGDALMVYGAYKLLTHESAPQSTTVDKVPSRAATPSTAAHQFVPGHVVSSSPQNKARTRSVFRPSRSRRSR